MYRIRVPLRATRSFKPMVLDHLERLPATAEFSHFSSDRAGVLAAKAARRFPDAHRAILVEALERQYAGSEPHAAVRRNLDLLAVPGTTTVTTGHQLCLFTGPLYVPFKILNAVRAAAELSTPQAPVVPVFWMATEDHDRPEIDHTWIAGTKVEWPGPMAGAVGRLHLEGIGPVVEQACSLLGHGVHAEELRDLLRSSYRPDHTLAQATRAFVSALFGRFGVVVVDGDDPALKGLFAPAMEQELLHQVAQAAVAYAGERAGEQYAGQAHARDINLFLLGPGYRSRITMVNNGYQVLDDGPSFTADELLELVRNAPERFSPNVLLRPVYEATVLPDIAYVGGGGELAYWLQLRWVFDALRTPMPAVLLRTSAALLHQKDLRRCRTLGLEPDMLFQERHVLEARVAEAHAGFDTSLHAERDKIFAVYDAMAARAKAADATLERAVRGAAERAMKGLDALELKLVRAAKRQRSGELESLHRVLDALFPNGTLQERRENFMPWYAKEGPAFFDRLLAELDPFNPAFTLLFGEEGREGGPAVD